MLQEQIPVTNDDYAGDRPYQIIQPAYPAPKFLQSFSDLKSALRECKTLCRLEGKPFRVVRWGRSGSGAAGGISCGPCRGARPTSRFPSEGLSGCLHGYPDATPIAEIQPDGQRIVFDAQGRPQVVGKPNYVVSANPFPRMYSPRAPTQTYLNAIRTAEYLAGSGQKAYIATKEGVPVGYVAPGNAAVQSISKQHFRELLAQSKGASFLGKGA
jgi:hypothetical protein